MTITDTKPGMTKDALLASQMQMPERLQIEEISPNHSRFILQPLEQGYGVTIGNSFRRVLLSSIPGSAIIGIKITDVMHEFQTIPGVIEDMSEIILNLKEVRFKHIDKKTQRITFHIKGESWTDKIIQEASNAIEVLNPEHHIAELADDGELEVELRIGRGLGYIPAEEQQITDFSIGMLPIDSVFTPIKNVIYTIEPYRVGQKTDYERLILDVSTDGTITPQEAVNYSAKLIMDHIKYFIHLEEYDEDGKHSHESAEDEVKEAEKNKLRKILLTPVDELELSVRAHNCLKAANIKSLAELVQLQEHELLKFRNFGRKSLTELTEVVHQYGLEFGMNVEKFLREDTPKSSDIFNNY